MLGDAGEVQGLRMLEPALAVGQGEQRRDEALLLVAQLHQFLAGRAQRLDGGFRVGDRDLEQGAPGGERGPQLVRGVGDEMPLRLKRCLQAREQVIKGLPELGELVVAAAQVQAAVQVARGDVPGGRGDRPQGPHEATRDQPADPDREHGHDRDQGHARRIPAWLIRHGGDDGGDGLPLLAAVRQVAWGARSRGAAGPGEKVWPEN